MKLNTLHRIPFFPMKIIHAKSSTLFIIYFKFSSYKIAILLFQMVMIVVVKISNFSVISGKTDD